MTMSVTVKPLSSSNRETVLNNPDYDQLITQHSGMLWRIAGSYEANRELRQELHQEILIAAWRALPRFRGDANIKTYLARIAHNRSISHVASQVRQPPQEPLNPDISATDDSPSANAEHQHQRDRLMAGVRQLPLPMRQVVSLTLEGFAPREISEVLGLSANIVSIRLTRAKKRLRQAMENAV